MPCMVQTIQASNIKELGELVDLFGLKQNFALDFFPEWQQDLPALSDFEQQALQDMQQDYQHLSNGPDLQFLKLVKGESPVFGLSNRFYMANADHDLQRVLQILKKLSGCIPVLQPSP